MRSRTGVRSHAMSTMGCWRSITRRPNGRFAPSLSDARTTFFSWLELRRRTRCRHLLARRFSQTQWTRPRTLSPPSPDPHRRPSGQPDRRTAPLEPRRRTQYPLLPHPFNSLSKCPHKYKWTPRRSVPISKREHRPLVNRGRPRAYEREAPRWA